MGYPMTWQRIVNRNHLAKGDYAEAPWEWRAGVNVDERDDEVADVSRYRRERLGALETKAALLAGDLRRLVQDGQDEQAICRAIAQRTGVEVDVVAGVLKEFFAL